MTQTAEQQLQKAEQDNGGRKRFCGEGAYRCYPASQQLPLSLTLPVGSWCPKPGIQPQQQLPVGHPDLPHWALVCEQSANQQKVYKKLYCHLVLLRAEWENITKLMSEIPSPGSHKALCRKAELHGGRSL